LFGLECDKIDLLVYDFDGVMTDNRVYVAQDGMESVSCNRGDGMGVAMLKRAGINQIILSTEVNPVVRQRAAKLGIPVISASEDKRKSLCEYGERHGLDLKRVLYVGNDTNDLEVVRVVGFTVCPSDAHPEIQRLARWRTKACGGGGVIRELADALLSSPPEVRSDEGARNGDGMEHIAAQFQQGIDIRRKILADVSCLHWLASLANTACACLQRGGKIIFAGNGGSFADAQHLAAEFVERFMMERGASGRPLPCNEQIHDDRGGE